MDHQQVTSRYISTILLGRILIGPARTDGYLTMKNGVKFAISDHRDDKSFNELLEHPDIDDMFYVQYPAGNYPKQPPRNIDPGRVRSEPLFTAMYGD